MKLSNKLKAVPKSPGVYFLKNSKGKVIYIGKARNLKNRVRSYFQPYSGFSGLRANLTDEITNIDWQETDSEVEALLLESRLIKKLKPRYNILMRDDKNYSFVVFTKPRKTSPRGKEEFPRIFTTHQPKDDASEYLGPFTDAGALKKVLRILRGIFPYYIIKKHPRNKCTYCHIGLCPGPNPSKTNYKKNIQNIKNILKGKRTSLIKKLGKQMRQLVKKEQFEKAAELRDKIEALARVFEHATVLSPDNIIRTYGRKYEHERGLTSFMKLLRKHLGIKLSPNKEIRIEGYDISNIQGAYATGSMVVFTLRGSDPLKSAPDKKEYRKFRIKTVKGANDVAMMKEVLRRRFKNTDWPMPDLILVDGGKAQLNATLYAAQQGLSLLGGTVPAVIALAKREEEIYVPTKLKPIKLPKASPLLLLLMHVRDEAHRFAIGYYRGLHRQTYQKEN